MDQIVDKIFDVAITHEKKNLVEITLKGCEEMGELAQAVLSYNNTPGCSYKEKTLEDITEEASDVIIVAMSVLSKAGVTKEEMKEMMNKKLDKWLLKAMV